MKSIYRELITNTMIFGLGSIGAKAVLFFMVPLYTMYLRPEELGVADLIITTSEFAVPICTLAISNALYRYAFDPKYDDKEVLKCYYLVYIVSIVIALIVTNLWIVLGSYPQYAKNLFFLICFSALNESYGLYVKARGNSVIYSLNNILQIMLQSVFIIVFVVVLRQSTNGYVFSIIIARLISILFLFKFGKSPVIVSVNDFDRELLMEMLKFSAPLVLNSVFWGLISSIDRYMLAIYLDVASVGLYNVAAKIPSLLSTLVSIFIQAWTISAYKEYEKGNNKIYLKVYNYFNLFMCSFASFLIVISRVFLKYYVAEDYIEAADYIPCLLLSAFFLGYSSFFGVVFSAVKKSGILAMSSFFAVLLNICLNYFLIINIGVLGAAVSTVICYSVIACIRGVQAQTYINCSILDFKLAFALIILGMQTILITLYPYVEHYNFIGTILILYMYKKEILIIIYNTKEKLF